LFGFILPEYGSSSRRGEMPKATWAKRTIQQATMNSFIIIALCITFVCANSHTRHIMNDSPIIDDATVTTEEETGETPVPTTNTTTDGEGEGRFGGFGGPFIGQPLVGGLPVGSDFTLTQLYRRMEEQQFLLDRIYRMMFYQCRQYNFGGFNNGLVPPFAGQTLDWTQPQINGFPFGFQPPQPIAVQGQFSGVGWSRSAGGGGADDLTIIAPAERTSNVDSETSNVDESAPSNVEDIAPSSRFASARRVNWQPNTVNTANVAN